MQRFSLVLAAFLCMSPLTVPLPATAQESGAAELGKNLWQEWQATRNLGDWASENLPDMANNVFWKAAILTKQGANYAAYLKNCAEDAPYHGKPLCNLLTPQLRESQGQFWQSSPFTVITGFLVQQSGVGNAPSEEATRLLTRLRQVLSYEEKANHAAYYLEALFPALRTPPAGLAEVLEGMRIYAQTYGGTAQQSAAAIFEAEGF